MRPSSCVECTACLPDRQGPAGGGPAAHQPRDGPHRVVREQPGLVDDGRHAARVHHLALRRPPTQLTQRSLPYPIPTPERRTPEVAGQGANFVWDLRLLLSMGMGLRLLLIGASSLKDSLIAAYVSTHFQP